MCNEYMQVATSVKMFLRVKNAGCPIQALFLGLSGIMAAMPKTRPHNVLLPPDDRLFSVKRRKALPHAFVLEALATLPTETRTMFGCLAVYLGDKIVLILRDGREPAADNGVWLATTEEHHQSLAREFPSMRSIQLFGNKITGWQVLPADAPDFEPAALRLCELIIARDPRIGKIPKSRQKSIAGTAAKTKRRS